MGTLFDISSAQKLQYKFLKACAEAVKAEYPCTLAKSKPCDIAVKNSDAYKAYNRGKVSTKLELRKQEIMLARVGSPLALENSRRALLDMEDDE